jgi:hypothetical protein
MLLRNQNRVPGHWIEIKTVGIGSNHDGFGARVEIKAGDATQTAEVRANSSFESASDPRLHFGVGAPDRIDSIAVHWPSGKTQIIGGEVANHELTVEEGKGARRR